MDHNGDYVHTVLPYILSLLERGLGQRISLLTHSLSPDPEVGEKSAWLLEIAEHPRVLLSLD